MSKVTTKVTTGTSYFNSAVVCFFAKIRSTLDAVTPNFEVETLL
jgi:hypothetical protein